MALVIALALMTGLQGELRDRILGSQAHVYVWKTGGITDYHAEVAKLLTSAAAWSAPRRRSSARRWSPPARAQAFISVKGDRSRARADGHRHRDGDACRAASTRSTHETEDEPPAILLGKDLAKQLGVDGRRHGDALTPQGTLSPMGMMPRTRRAAAWPASSASASTSSTRRTASCRSTVGERLLGKDTVDLIQLRVDDIYDAPRIADDDPEAARARRTSRRTGPT